jgi:hypothetical protein
VLLGIGGMGGGPTRRTRTQIALLFPKRPRRPIGRTAALQLDREASETNKDERPLDLPFGFDR